MAIVVISRTQALQPVRVTGFNNLNHVQCWVSGSNFVPQAQVPIT